jgi:hypothetical protein
MYISPNYSLIYFILHLSPPPPSKLPVFLKTKLLASENENTKI